MILSTLWAHYRLFRIHKHLAFTRTPELGPRLKQKIYSEMVKILSIWLLAASIELIMLMECAGHWLNFIGY